MNGMTAFGEKFESLYSPGYDKSLFDAFEFVLNDLSYKVYAIDPLTAGSVLLELVNPSINGSNSTITFDVVGATGRKFKVFIHDDKKDRMNVAMPVFVDILTYLGVITKIIQDDPTTATGMLDVDEAKKFLLAHSLISRCK